MRPVRNEACPALDRFPYKSLFFFKWGQFEKKPRICLTDFGWWTDTNEFRPVRTRTGTRFASWKRDISPEQPLMWQRIWNALLLVTKAWNPDWNVCKNMALVSFRSHVSTSEDFHFGSDLNSYWSHVISTHKTRTVSSTFFFSLHFPFQVTIAHLLVSKTFELEHRPPTWELLAHVIISSCYPEDDSEIIT